MIARIRMLLLWLVLPLLSVIAIVAAVFSPLPAWRDPVYVMAGFAGLIALVLLMFQPVLASTALPGVAAMKQKQIHKITGLVLVLAVIAHIVGLWITSPPDVIDALTFSSPTLFTPFGVISMWAVFLTASLFAFRPKLKLSPKTWRRCHLSLAWVIVLGTIVHAMLIEGTMEIITKTALCLIAAAALAKASYSILARQ